MMATTVTLLFTTISLMTTIMATTTADVLSFHPKPYEHRIKTRSTAQKYCGNNIVNVLRLLCDGNYFSVAKRTKQTDHFKSDHFEVSDLWDDINPKRDYTPTKLTDNFIISPKKAFNLLNKQMKNSNRVVLNRKRRGIVEECCKKACTVRELYSYCD